MSLILTFDAPDESQPDFIIHLTSVNRDGQTARFVSYRSQDIMQDLFAERKARDVPDHKFPFMSVA